MRRLILTLVGYVAIAMGLLWIGQGLGIVHWPESSFMLDQRPWAVGGAVLAAAGLILVLAMRRK